MSATKIEWGIQQCVLSVIISVNLGDLKIPAYYQRNPFNTKLSFLRDKANNKTKFIPLLHIYFLVFCCFSSKCARLKLAEPVNEI